MGILWTRNIVIVDSASIYTAHPSNGQSSSRRYVPPSDAPVFLMLITFQTSVRMRCNINDSLHFFSTETCSGEHYVPCKVRGRFMSSCLRVSSVRSQVSCHGCRSPMFDEGRNTVLAYPGSFKFHDREVPRDFQPTAHIFYSQRYELPPVLTYRPQQRDSSVLCRLMDVPDGIPKWSGHKGKSELVPEMSADGGYGYPIWCSPTSLSNLRRISRTMPRYKGAPGTHHGEPDTEGRKEVS